MIPMQSIDHLSPDERRALIEAAQAEYDELRQRLSEADNAIALLKQQLAEAQAGLAYQEQLIIRQRNVVLQQESLMDAIGAGGVSAQRITGDEPWTNA